MFTNNEGVSHLESTTRVIGIQTWELWAEGNIREEWGGKQHGGRSGGMATCWRGEGESTTWGKSRVEGNMGEGWGGGQQVGRDWLEGNMEEGMG